MICEKSLENLLSAAHLNKQSILKGITGRSNSTVQKFEGRREHGLFKELKVGQGSGIKGRK